jgi:hypothetical protein
MSIRIGRTGLAFVLALAGALLWQPATAHAHPQLAGKWSAPVPPGGLMVYEFGCGEYRGDDVWRGPFTLFVMNVPVASGTYELRMNGLVGSLGFMDCPGGQTTVGLADLGARVITYKDVTYKSDH